MKSSVLALLLVVVVLLSSGGSLRSTEASYACENPDKLFSLLDLEQYNKSYPFVDYMTVTKSIVDHMLGRDDSISDANHDLIMYWMQVCRAKDPEEEAKAWKDLARAVHHMLHTDESVFNIAKSLLGDEGGAWVMNAPELSGDDDYDCLEQLTYHFEKHCGRFGSYGMKHLMTLIAMCTMRVKEDDFAKAAQHACRDYIYIPHPLNS